MDIKSSKKYPLYLEWVLFFIKTRDPFAYNFTRLIIIHKFTQFPHLYSFVKFVSYFEILQG